MLVCFRGYFRVPPMRKLGEFCKNWKTRATFSWYYPSPFVSFYIRLAEESERVHKLKQQQSMVTSCQKSLWLTKLRNILNSNRGGHKPIYLILWKMYKLAKIEYPFSSTPQWLQLFSLLTKIVPSKKRMIKETPLYKQSLQEYRWNKCCKKILSSYLRDCWRIYWYLSQKIWRMQKIAVDDQEI